MIPTLLSTWTFGQRANRAAWDALMAGDALGAVEAGARDAESDLSNHTVGRGGSPDASGRVSLDAAIMLSPSQHGAVACVRTIEHPITLARWVMERTPHRLLVGPDADAFARECGMESVDLLTEEGRVAFETWKQTSQPDRLANVENQLAAHHSSLATSPDHDTIGLVAISAAGQLAAACTTSGLRFKMPGRVGDSPIVGAGLYCDPDAGAAVCTGRGELVQGVLGSFLAIETLRNGASASEAVSAVLDRIAKTHSLGSDDQVGIIVLGSDGSYGSGSLLPGFVVSIKTPTRDEQLMSGYVHGGTP